MKPPNMAPFFAAIWPRLSEVARANGYALALHGTLGRDLDLLAAPWVEEAASAEVLVNALAIAADGWVPEYAQAGEEPEPVKMPRSRPHGRRGWLIYFKRAEGYMDVSVMPRIVGYRYVCVGCGDKLLDTSRDAQGKPITNGERAAAVPLCGWRFNSTHGSTEIREEPVYRETKEAPDGE